MKNDTNDIPSSSDNATRTNEWLDYYHRFKYLESEIVRNGNQPRILYAATNPKAIVLIHGLSDSPYYVSKIGEQFFKWGYNVFMPILHSHGLIEEAANGMEDVDLTEWEANVDFAIEAAAKDADHVSIGGLSTGGVLAFNAIATDPRINGALYLFSAAFDLVMGEFDRNLGKWLGDCPIGEISEWLLTTPIADWTDSDDPLVSSAKPYRYNRVDKDGARELATLIKRVDRIRRRYDAKHPFGSPVFAAHSIHDTTANYNAIKQFGECCIPGQFELFTIDNDPAVSHASVVLPTSVARETPRPFEPGNPQFGRMMTAIQKFNQSL